MEIGGFRFEEQRHLHMTFTQAAHNRWKTVGAISAEFGTGGGCDWAFCFFQAHTAEFMDQVTKRSRAMFPLAGFVFSAACGHPISFDQAFQVKHVG